MLTTLLIGLDNSGKSSMLAHFKSPGSEGIIEVLPTLGFLIEEILLPQGGKGLVFDCGGGFRYREMWDHFVAEAHGVIYVIDCTDRDRMCTVKKNISMFFKHRLLQKKPVAFFLNKYDSPGSISKEDLKRVLQIDKKRIEQPFKIILGNSITREGVNDCFNFIAEKTKTRL